MPRRRASYWEPLGLAIALLLAAACVRRSTLPEVLTDDEFWQLSETLSEPAGTFTVSDNLVSNEPRVAENARWLRPAGGVFVGVGPEQNFSYIARLEPTMAFIVDVRRENRNLHLLYKVLFELSADRADFVSVLFSRPRPADLASTASVSEIFSRYERVPASQEYLSRNIVRIRQRLRTRGLPLSESDLDGMDRALRAFFSDGPEIQFWGSRAVGADAVRPSYRQLMTAADATGQARSYLSTEDAFRFVKDLHARNMIVPVIGDFAGPRALRGIADYVQQRGAVIEAFYGSNVGVYLTNEQTRAFCRNLAGLPASRGAWFIESNAVRPLTSRLNACRAGTK